MAVFLFILLFHVNLVVISATFTPITETLILLKQQREEDFHQYLEALDPVLQQYSRPSEDKPFARMSCLCSLPTSTTSNPCRADCPVNCCNTQSRALIADEIMHDTIFKIQSQIKPLF